MPPKLNSHFGIIDTKPRRLVRISAKKSLFYIFLMVTSLWMVTLLYISLYIDYIVSGQEDENIQYLLKQIIERFEVSNIQTADDLESLLDFYDDVYFRHLIFLPKHDHDLHNESESVAMDEMEDNLSKIYICCSKRNPAAAMIHGYSVWSTINFDTTIFITKDCRMLDIFTMHICQLMFFAVISSCAFTISSYLTIWLNKWGLSKDMKAYRKNRVWLYDKYVVSQIPRNVNVVKHPSSTGLLLPALTMGKSVMSVRSKYMAIASNTDNSFQSNLSFIATSSYETSSEKLNSETCITNSNNNPCYDDITLVDSIQTTRHDSKKVVKEFNTKNEKIQRNVNEFSLLSPQTKSLSISDCSRIDAGDCDTLVDRHTSGNSILDTNELSLRNSQKFADKKRRCGRQHTVHSKTTSCQPNTTHDSNPSHTPHNTNTSHKIHHTNKFHPNGMKHRQNKTTRKCKKLWTTATPYTSPKTDKLCKNISFQKLYSVPDKSTTNIDTHQCHPYTPGGCQPCLSLGSYQTKNLSGGKNECPSCLRLFSAADTAEFPRQGRVMESSCRCSLSDSCLNRTTHSSRCPEIQSCNLLAAPSHCVRTQTYQRSISPSYCKEHSHQTYTSPSHRKTLTRSNLAALRPFKRISSIRHASSSDCETDIRSESNASDEIVGKKCIRPVASHIHHDITFPHHISNSNVQKNTLPSHPLLFPSCETIAHPIPDNCKYYKPNCPDIDEPCSNSDQLGNSGNIHSRLLASPDLMSGSTHSNHNLWSNHRDKSSNANTEITPDVSHEDLVKVCELSSSSSPKSSKTKREKLNEKLSSFTKQKNKRYRKPYEQRMALLSLQRLKALVTMSRNPIGCDTDCFSLCSVCNPEKAETRWRTEMLNIFTLHRLRTAVFFIIYIIYTIVSIITLKYGTHLLHDVSTLKQIHSVLMTSFAESGSSTNAFDLEAIQDSMLNAACLAALISVSIIILFACFQPPLNFKTKPQYYHGRKKIELEIQRSIEMAYRRKFGRAKKLSMQFSISS